MANKLIKIISYNSTGFASDRQCFIRDLINDNDPDLIFVQETWLLNSNMDKLNGVHTDYLSAGVSSMPDNELLIGRPHGGLAIFWKKNLVDAIRFVTIPGTTRACACIVKIGTEELLCVNLYLPNDNYSKSAVEHSFMETLDIVEMFIESCQIRNVILAGDMNCDFTRKNAHDSGLRSMLKICEEFGEQFGVQYNPKKTVCIMFSRRLGTIKPVIKLCGSEIKWVDTIHHLGNVISCNLTEAHDVKHKKGDLIQRVNSVLSTLDGSNDQILKKVFNTQCSHLYGTPAWRFRDKSVREFVTAWNRSVRRLFRLPFMTHTRYLPHMLDAPPVLDQTSQ